MPTTPDTWLAVLVVAPAGRICRFFVALAPVLLSKVAHIRSFSDAPSSIVAGGMACLLV